MRGDGGGVEGRNPQAQMIEIGAAGARRSLRRPGLVGRNDIDQRVPGCASVPWRFSNAQPSTCM